jgi:GNAT superfamily N-acetyltransferase
MGRPATGRDLETMAETLTLAFAGDPVWGGWAFPDRRRANEQRRSLFRLWTESMLRYGAARVTDRCEAVAEWYPPGATANAEVDQERLVVLAHELLGEHAGLFLQGCELVEASHPQGRPHYYLSLLGTHDEHRGKGLGMALLREGLALFDAEKVPAYLESTNPVNTPRYERIGFAKIGAYALPGNGPTVEQMWREPGACTRPASRSMA